MKTRRRGFLTLCLLGVASCGGGSSGGTVETPGGSCSTVGTSDVMPWEGVYQMLSDTKNTTSCAAEGPSILASQTQTFFFLRAEAGIVGTDLWLLSCTDVADCQSKRTQLDQSQASMSIGPPAALLLSFACKGPNGSLEETVVSTGFSQTDGTCQSPSLSVNTLTHDTSGNTRIEGAHPARRHGQAGQRVLHHRRGVRGLVGQQAVLRVRRRRGQVRPGPL